jgi:hypothetical protein
MATINGVFTIVVDESKLEEIGAMFTRGELTEEQAKDRAIRECLSLKTESGRALKFPERKQWPQHTA